MLKFTLHDIEKFFFFCENSVIEIQVEHGVETVHKLLRELDLIQLVKHLFYTILSNE